MKDSKELKIISYILLPIFIAIIIISILYSFAKDSYVKNKEEYFKTTYFAEDYIGLISRMSKLLIYMDDNWSYIEDEETGNKIYYINLNNYNYNIRLKDNYILIIYKNKAITNVDIKENCSINEIKKFIENYEGEKLNIINGNINATSLIRKSSKL